MTPRDEWLTDSLQRYLDRRTMPQGLKDKPGAQRDEAQALVKALLRQAPSKGYQDWWEDFSERLAEDAQTRAWPTEGEIKKAAASLRRVSSTTTVQPGEIDPLEAAARRINAGESVGDGFIYGIDAVGLVRKHGITYAQLRAYRSAAYFADKATYGEEKAKAREAARIAKHEDAEAAWAEREKERAA